MLKWIRKYPFAGVLAAVAAGILLSYYDRIAVFPTLIAGFALFVLLVGMGSFFPKQREVLWGSAGLLFFFVFSVWNTVRAVQKSEWVKPGDVQAVYSVQVTQTPVERAKSWQTFVRLDGGKEAVLYLQKDSLLRVPQAGDRLPRPTPDDEYSFDYGHYLQLQGLVGSGVVQRGGMLFVRHEPLRGLMPRMRLLRDKIERLFSGFALRERSVLEALLLGDRRHLNADTRAAFAASGAMHVLAVSGKSLSARSAIALPSTYSWKSIIYGEDATLRAIPMCELNGQTLYFANINLGATSLVDRPDCYGNKYFWAGTTPYPNDVYKNDLRVEGTYGNYGQPYYKEDNFNTRGYTKYITDKAHAYNKDESYVDNKTVLDPEDDVATVTLGSPWRIPTVEEWQALINNCQWTFDEPNNGWKITGRGAFSGNVVFLPKTGLNTQGNGLVLNDQGVPGDAHYHAADGSLDIYTSSGVKTYYNPYRDTPINVRAVRTSPL